jgi:hypothetical protein
MWAFTEFTDVCQQMQNNFAAKIEKEYGNLQKWRFYTRVFTRSML